MELANSEKDNVIVSIVLTEISDLIGFLPHKTKMPVCKTPACTFLYFLGCVKKKEY